MVNIYKFSGRNVDVTEALRAYVTEKLQRLDRFNDSITEARVTLTVRDSRDVSRRNSIEVQLNIPGGIIRAEEHSTDMYAAIDRIGDVLERQLRKFKTKLMRNRHEIPADSAPEHHDDDAHPAVEIVRSKSFDVRPMMPEDAALQMEALGHDFYVFIKADTSSTAVVYRRKDGNYGLIEPQASA